VKLKIVLEFTSIAVPVGSIADATDNMR